MSTRTSVLVFTNALADTVSGTVATVRGELYGNAAFVVLANRFDFESLQRNRLSDYSGDEHESPFR